MRYSRKSSKWARDRTDDHLVKYGPLTKEGIEGLIGAPDPRTSELSRKWGDKDVAAATVAGTPEEPGKLGLYWVTQTKEEVLNHREPAIERRPRPPTYSHNRSEQQQSSHSLQQGLSQ